MQHAGRDRGVVCGVRIGLTTAWSVISDVKFSTRRGICTTVVLAVMKQNVWACLYLFEMPSLSIAHIGALVHGAPR
jgi:hypothetical protein